MSKVVDHFYATRFAANLLPTRDPLKTLQRIVDLRFGNVVKSRRGDGHRRVAHIEFADEGNFEDVITEFESRTVGRITDVANSLRAIFGEPDLDHLRAAISRDFDTVVVVAVDQDHSVFRHDVEQALKTELDLVDVAKDVGVIELDIVHDHQFGQVMNELRALVEKRSVVFVAFDHEIFGIVEPRTLTEIFWNSADQIARLFPALFHDPREQGGRGRFPVRAGDDEIVFRAKKMVF